MSFINRKKDCGNYQYASCLRRVSTSSSFYFLVGHSLSALKPRTDSPSENDLCIGLLVPARKFACP